LAPIITGFILSCALRWTWRREPVVTNIEASYHVLLTVQAMSQTPGSVHRFLPIVTLGRPLDRDVRFGASVRGPGGIYYYTSFAPLGFVAPWAFFRVTGLAPNIDSLLVFNLLIHLAATLLLVRLVAECAGALGADDRTVGWIVLATAGSYLFAREALYSHGIVYWHHSLFQLAWLLQLTFTARLLRAADAGSETPRGDAIGLLVSSAVGPSIEWSGFLATFAVALALWWRARAGRQVALRRVAWLTLAAGCVAGFTIVAHFAWVIGVDPLREALHDRAAARSVAHASLVRLARGYVASLGNLVLLAGGVGAVFAMTTPKVPRWLMLLWLVATAPLFENLLMAQHAGQYQYDRLKGLVVVILELALMIPRLPERWRDRALIAWLVALAWTISYLRPTREIPTVPPLATNVALMNRVRAVARPCAVYATNAIPRGWVALAVGGNTYEAIPTVDSVRALMQARGACQGLYFTAALDVGETMYIWRRAIILDAASARVDTIEWSPPARARR
jgi:hypothetical protein